MWEIIETVSYHNLFEDCTCIRFQQCCDSRVHSCKKGCACLDYNDGFFSAAGDINAASSAQANKTFLPWETHLFTRLLKYGKQSVIWIVPECYQWNKWEVAFKSSNLAFTAMGKITGKLVSNTLSRKATSFHRQANWTEPLYKKNCPVDFQTRQAKSSSQLVNLTIT